MKLFLRVLFLYVPGLLLTLLLLASLFIWQQNLISQKQLRMIIEYVRTQDTATVVSELRAELFGTDEWHTDSSFDRQPVKGRGHSPWVMRGNLDQKHRMLSFALAPGVWASYETESASLYQVLQGEILMEGAAYDHRHGPQPVSSGAWIVRNLSAPEWYLQVPDSEELLPATVRYLGHEYGSGRKTAALRFVVSTDEHSVELTETPELLREDGKSWLLRQFLQHGETSGVSASFRDSNNNLTKAQGNVLVELSGATAIPTEEYKGKSSTSEGQLEHGKAVIENSDCLGCHSDQQQLVGPPWSQVSGRYRGKTQDATLSSLARSIKRGSADKWGQVPMPAHPEMSLEDAMSAVAYILSRTESDVELNIPVDANGQPYAASRDYDINPRLEELHPAFSISNLLPEGFEPKVGGMDFTADGKLLVASWDLDGAVFQIDTEAPGGQRVRRIAEGLQEPLGLKVIGERLFVLQKQELTELIDRDGDGIIDEYRAYSYDWPSSSNFHSFAFGLVHRDDALYALLSICVMPGGAACSDQLSTQGKLLRIALEDGSVEVVASGFRTPNGIALGPKEEIFVTDNEGDWLPASKLVHIQTGHFYGSRAVPGPGVMSAVETPPVVWLPQNEIGNSPTQPLLLDEGPYAGQMIHGDIYNGGLKRVYMEPVAGALQGAVLQFSGGLQSGVNRLLRGPDGDIYVGELGNPPNWGQLGKAWYGLERLSYRGKPAYEILQVNARSDGFSLTLTEPLDDSLSLEPDDLIARQWFYYPTEQYGGPKYDSTELPVTALELSGDRRRIRARIPGLKPGYVVYLRLHQRLVSKSGRKLWADEAWYTLNAVPAVERNSEDASAGLQADAEGQQPWIELFDGKSFGGWRNYGANSDQVEKWIIGEEMLELVPDKFPLLWMAFAYFFGDTTGDLIYAAEKFRNFELNLEWKISENGNSGIKYLVPDETRKLPYGVEMQVLHNEGHPDGKNYKHRAGDLYDLVAADPETVRPPGQWNEARIRFNNNRIQHWLNGTLVVDITRGSSEWDAAVATSKYAGKEDFATADAGYIVLQDHGDPVWYRNIKIRRIEND